MTQFDMNIYAEEGVLANLLASPKVIEDVSEILHADDFHEPRNKKIFEVMQDLFRNGKPISTAAVAAELREAGILNEVGGMESLQRLSDPAAGYLFDGDGVTYAEIVKDESNRRAVQAAGQQLAQMAALGAGHTIPEVMARAQKVLHEVNERVNTKNDSANLGDMVEDQFVRIQERSQQEDGLQGVPSGFVDLDKYTSGFKPGNLVVIAARPGVGKSTLAVDFARAASIKAGLVSMIFSLEMSKEEIADRTFAAEANVLLDRIRKGTTEEEDWDRLRRAGDRIREAKLIIDDSPSITIDHIRLAAMRQAATEEGLDLIVVDYLQLMSSPRKVESRQQEVAEFSRALKLLGREIGCPVIALSQLNRGSENRQDKRPKMSDLRESGAIEQDADIIILLHRPESTDMPGGEQTVLILAKNRNGQADVTIPLTPLLQYSKFVSAAGQFPAPVDDAVRQADPAAFIDTPGPQDPVDLPDTWEEGAEAPPAAW